MTEEKTGPRIAGVSERDTDLLLLEEFMSSPGFCAFFLGAIGMENQGYRYVEGARSVTDSTGESDLEIVFESSSVDRLICLVENKINAGFQPRQAERYRERGANHVRQGRCATFVTVLLAPGVYFPGDTKGFDVRLEYEDVRDWFGRSDLPDGRKSYKVSVLTSAIEKSSSGYQMIADSAVGEFWRDYWRLCLDIAPDLGMREPENKPAGSTFVYFYDAVLPKGVDLVHKMNHGHFDLQFAGMGEQLAEMREIYGSRLDEDMKIVRAAKSASIRLTVPKLAVADPLDEQHEAVLACLAAGRRLLQWGGENVPPRGDG